MPNIKSAKKRMRSSESARVRNLGFSTIVKTNRRKFIESLQGNDEKLSGEAYSSYCSVLDRAANRGIIKKNTAIRRKSRAAEKLRAVTA